MEKVDVGMCQAAVYKELHFVIQSRTCDRGFDRFGNTDGIRTRTNTVVSVSENSLALQEVMKIRFLSFENNFEGFVYSFTIT